jgi:RNA-directed DNA polymerase
MFGRCHGIEASEQRASVSPGATGRTNPALPSSGVPSACNAVAKARERCWRYDWVLDLDIKGFFDNIDWELMLKAVRRHTDCPWVLLYIERWLKSPEQMEDGCIAARTAGTPQGGVISPLLANLFLHYAFDMMAREFPRVPFDADDAICHCLTEAEARALWQALASRMADCKLTLHPEKTKIVYGKDAKRRRDLVQRDRRSLHRGKPIWV